MEFFLDFEAQQFSNKIISIGCVTSSGDTFYSLVKPINKKFKKLTPFIVQLTGITDEMLAEADGPNVVFSKFYDFVLGCNPDDKDDVFYAYGDSDKIFLERTLTTVVDPVAVAAIEYILARLVDASAMIGSYFGLRMVSLKKVVGFFRNEEIEQNHVAIEDALMLQEAFNNCLNLPKPEVCPFEDAKPTPADPNSKRSKQKARKKKNLAENNCLMLTRNKPSSKTKYVATNSEGKRFYFIKISNLIKYCNPSSPIKSDSNKALNRVVAIAKNNGDYVGYKLSVYKKEEEKTL